MGYRCTQRHRSHPKWNGVRRLVLKPRILYVAWGRVRPRLFQGGRRGGGCSPRRFHNCVVKTARRLSLSHNNRQLQTGEWEWGVEAYGVTSHNKKKRKKKLHHLGSKNHDQQQQRCGNAQTARTSATSARATMAASCRPSRVSVAPRPARAPATQACSTEPYTAIASSTASSKSSAGVCSGKREMQRGQERW